MWKGPGHFLWTLKLKILSGKKWRPLLFLKYVAAKSEKSAKIWKWLKIATFSATDKYVKTVKKGHEAP